MIQFDEGLTLCGRVTWGYAAGYIIAVDSRTYTVRWMDGQTTTLLRPDLDEDEYAEAAE